MTIIIMLFVLPLGIVIYIYDKKIKKTNLQTFHEYAEKVKKSNLSDEEKLQRIDEMYYQNGYYRVDKTADSLTLQKKYFNLGLFFIYFGLTSYFAFIFYYIYYYFILKPDEIKVRL